MGERLKGENQNRYGKNDLRMEMICEWKWFFIDDDFFAC